MLNNLGIEPGPFIWIVLSIPLVVGCICGLIAVRLKSSDRTWNILGIVLAPIPAVVAVYIYTVGGDFIYGAHNDSTYAAMLIQSMARGSLFLPAMLIMCTPLSTIASSISQLLCVGLARLRRGSKSL
jgi:hypothetical protein